MGFFPLLLGSYPFCRILEVNLCLLNRMLYLYERKKHISQNSKSQELYYERVDTINLKTI